MNDDLLAWLVSMIDGKNHECPYRQAYERINELSSRLGRIVALVNEQAEDEGLWAVPIPPQSQSIVEAYLQQELRRLHQVIEDKP